jgi:signal transduction histidine kinase
MGRATSAVATLIDVLVLDHEPPTAPSPSPAIDIGVGILALLPRSWYCDHGQNAPVSLVERVYHRRVMPSQWLVVAAETDPLTRARKLQKSWERLLADGALSLELPPDATAGLRPTIVESWRRSLATGLDPTDSLAPIEADESEVLERWFEHPLGSLTHVLTEQLRKVAEESRSIVAVTDASGLVLHRLGEEWLKERAAEQNHLVEGARWSEAADGTNGIGTALAADHAFQVFAFEHFNERHHEWICSGAPVHDLVSGQTIGLIDLSSLWRIAHPRSLELVTTAARTIEQCLLDVRRDQDARLSRRYGDLMTRSTDLLVSRDGYVLAGPEPAHTKPLDVPEGGGQVSFDDGSVASAEPLGQGEAYLVRRPVSRGATSAPFEVLERAEKHVRELVTEQAALRQVATLVARESSPDQLFAAVAEQVAQVFDVPHVRLVRYEPESSVVVGGFSDHDDGPFPIGSRWPLDSPGVVATVRQTGRPARVEDYARKAGEIAAVVRGAGMRSAVASPIVVARRSWGAMVVLCARDEALPRDAESRLTDFTELVATAIANAESRGALAVLADEQAALRRVATLVARGIGPEGVFEAVAAEVSVLFGSQLGAIVRFEHDGTVTVLGDIGGPHEAGKRVVLDPGYVVHVVRETSRSARFDTDDPSGGDMPSLVRSLGIRSAVASPIVVQGELWGAVTAVSLDGPLAPGAERRLTGFTELIATAVANVQAREQLRALADEQAALRRVATLVARGARPARIFSAVSDEVGRLFDSDQASVMRFDSEGPATVIAGVAQKIEDVVPLGTRWELHDSLASAHVFRTGRSARVDRPAVSSAGGPATETIIRLDLQSTVASPIVVEGRLWGTVTVSSSGEPLPADAEQRLEKFTELVATAIANADSRSELATSRRRIVTSADEARQRIERDLHDGIQQRLIALTFRARAMTRKPPDELPGLAAELAEGLKDASDELREVSRGIHPTILTEAGLGPALRALARRSDVPIDVDVSLDERLPAPIEVAAYYIASEALTNVAKHAHANLIQLIATHNNGILTLEIRDDGIGGVDAGRGSGILGLTDRVEALGGTISIASPPRGGTTLSVHLPNTT